MNQLQALFRLQQLESSLDESKIRLQTIEQLLANDEAVQQAQAELTARQTERHTTQGTAKDLELELAGLEEKIANVEEMLYSGTITIPKEAQERQDEVASLKRRQEKLQEEFADVRQKLEQIELVIESAEETVKQADKESANRNKHLLDEGSQLRDRMGLWIQDRKRLLKEIEPANHKFYKRLKAQKNGVAVVRLENHVCSFCRVEQNMTVVYQVRQGDELVQCDSCSRILIEI